ncbi:hypothetical protein Droror1_Dr00019397 [Drosera rotundifolia]
MIDLLRALPNLHALTLYMNVENDDEPERIAYGHPSIHCLGNVEMYASKATKGLLQFIICLLKHATALRSLKFESFSKSYDEGELPSFNLQSCNGTAAYLQSRFAHKQASSLGHCNGTGSSKEDFDDDRVNRNASKGKKQKKNALSQSGGVASDPGRHGYHVQGPQASHSTAHILRHCFLSGLGLQGKNHGSCLCYEEA